MTNLVLRLKNVATVVACFAAAVCFSATILWSCNDDDKDKNLGGAVTVSPSGEVVVGTPLTAVYGGKETVTWQWNRDGATIGGATAATYTPTQTGSYTVTASASGFISKTSAAVNVIPVPDLAGDVTISPSADVTVNTELTASYSGSETVTWQWNKGGTAIGGATANKFTPTEEGIYSVTASANGFNSKTSAAVTVADPSLPDLAGDVTISPNADVITGTELTAEYNGSEAVAWQWYKENVAIGEATAAKYTPMEAGSYTVAASAEGFNSKTSAAVVVTEPEFSAAISGSAVTVEATKANFGGNGAVDADATVTINLTNATVNNALASTDVSAWFSAKIDGLTYNATADANATTIAVAIAGTPTAVSTANATITIPANILKNTQGAAITVVVAVGGNIAYNVIQADDPEITGFDFTQAGILKIGESNTAAGATVGSFDNVSGGTAPFSYSLVSGAGSTDNAFFTIDGANLKVGNAALTVTKVYSVRVRIIDAAGKSMEQQNEIWVEAADITDFTFTPKNNLIIGWLVMPPNNGTQAYSDIGNFSNPVGGQSPYTFSLVSGGGDTDNSLFQIPLNSSILQVGASALTEAKTYSVRVQIEGVGGMTFAKAVTFTVTYPPAETPSAAVSNDVIIYGLTNNSEGSGAMSVVGWDEYSWITLTNARLKNDDASYAGMDVSSWFSPTVQGLTYTIFAVYNMGTSIAIKVEGTPTATSSSAFSVNIPANELLDSNGNPTITSNLAVSGNFSYDITQAPEDVLEVTATNMSESVPVGTKFQSLQQAVNSLPNGVHTLAVIKDIELSSNVEIRQNLRITLVAGSQNRTISRGSGFAGTLFTVNGGLTLGSGDVSHTPTLIVDGNGSGTLVSAPNIFSMQRGAELRNAYVGLSVSRGNFANATSMSGGVIANCTFGVSLGGYGASWMARMTMSGGIVYGSDGGANANETSFTLYYGSVDFIGGMTAVPDIENTAPGENFTATYGTTP